MAGTRADIINDCQDGKLDGNYSPSEIRDARNNIPADIDQYSDCRDVIAAAIKGGDSSGGTDEFVDLPLIHDRAPNKSLAGRVAAVSRLLKAES